MPPAELRAILRRVAVEGPERARVDGVVVTPPPGAGGDAPVLDAFTGAVYQACYAGMPWPGDPAARAGRDLGPELAEANAGHDGWSPGWSFVRNDLEGRVVAQRGIRLRAAWPGHWVRADGVTGPLAPGAPLRMFEPAAPTVPVQPGFRFAYGHGGPDSERRRVRMYFNAAATGAPELVRGLTRRLHDLEIPFALKVADREDLAARRDCAVLWSETRQFRVVAALVRDVVEGLREPLADEVPPFTKRLGPGVGLAEDPSSGFSFGMERCAVLAEGLWEAAREGARDEVARLAAVAAAFAARDLDVERPWLASRANPDRYEPFGQEARA
jgi:hypothetical protein